MSRPSPSPDAPDAVENLEIELSLLWRRARAINYALARSIHPELEPAAYGLMTVLRSQGGVRLTELAASIGVGKPSVSRQVAFLVSIGLVRKQDDPADGRAQLIELTTTGRDRMEAIHLGRREAFRNMLAHWDDADVGTLASLIAKLNDDYADDFSRPRRQPG
ncbi:MarR family winged helix-turn-helix transcriptional regulator [Specibacter cremeus]|uniref:MarR family winged helix-turn-helix transcriptional regulator n=1 Tax=Specibacter cremeus TaxID=1629051 RepID=UPI000F79DE53|nr:MarR family winged helix-turn-helix transcriptional regulator [Specibacter cremeus]